MLIALLLSLFGGMFGNGNEVLGSLMTGHMEASLHAAIEDDVRRAHALRSLRRVNEDIDGLNKAVDKDASLLEKLIRDYDSTPGDFDRFFASALDRRQAGIDRIWARRSELLQHVTREEWGRAIAAAKAARQK